MIKAVSISVFLSLLLFSACDDSSTHSECGDGFLDVGEECDGTDFGSKTCISEGYYNGNISCTDRCKIDYSDCEQYGRCGDSNTDDPEECDSNNLAGQTCETLGYYGGELSCNNDCTFDLSDCEQYGRCGDNVLNGDEECDSQQFNGKTCEFFGYQGGNLSCSDDCKFDYSDCITSAVCGDNIISDNEECDTENLAGKTCESLGYYGGILSCKSNCTFNVTDCETFGICGDGLLNGSEECDATDLDNRTCETLGYYGGNLACKDDCTFDISECENSGMCGDGLLNGLEECDATDLDNRTCETLGYYGGNLACKDDCTFDTSDCETFGICGDGTIQTVYGEVCDGTNLFGESCASVLPSGEGTLLCSAACEFDTGLCNYCGDNSVNTASEQCDGTDLGGNTCINNGFASGTISCTSSCTLNTEACVSFGECGDGAITGTESCDGTLITPYACQSIGFWYGTSESCDASCIPSENGCHNFVQWGNAFDNLAQNIALDPSGNIYVTGYTMGSLDGNVNAGGEDIFITKYSPDGTKLWTKQAGSASNEEAAGIISDPAGNIYLSGYTEGALDGNINTGGKDMFVIKYDSDGNKLWTRLLGTSSDDYGMEITTDATGNIFVAGYTSGSIDGNVSSGGVDPFLVKYTADGTKLWTKQWGSSGADYTRAVTIDPDGNVYVTGYTSGSIDGNPTYGAYDIFLTKYTADGTKLWTKQWGSSGADYTRDLASDNTGSIYVTGVSNGTFAGNTSAGGYDAFLVKYTYDGTKLWTKQWGSPGTDFGLGVTAIKNGNTYVSGYTNGTFAGNTSAGGYDIFITTFTPDGTNLRTSMAGTDQNDYVQKNASDSSAVYTTGYTLGSLENNTNAGAKDLFVMHTAP